MNKCTAEVKRKKTPHAKKPTVQRCGLLAEPISFIKAGGSARVDAVLCPAHRDKAIRAGYVIISGSVSIPTPIAIPAVSSTKPKRAGAAFLPGFAPGDVEGCSSSPQRSRS